MPRNRFMNLDIVTAVARLQNRPEPSPDEKQSNRQWWAGALARYTAKRREALGLTVERAAELSGLAISEWYGLESDWVPDDLATLRTLAGTLQVRWTDYHTLAFLSRLHQGSL